MANIQIPNLPAVTALSGAELLEAVQAGSSVKVSLGQIAALFQIGTPLTFPLQVSVGGTGTTTSTGTGSVVLSNGPTVLFASGSASAPSISFTGDTNTGLWSPGADTIAFSEGGVEAMRITSAGFVGIGTTAPAKNLEVSQATDGATIRISSLQNDETHSITTPFGSLEFYSADVSGPGASVRASIGAQFSGTSGSSTALTFLTSIAGNVGERMRISGAGTVFFGSGETSAAPASAIIQATGGSGTDIAGANMNVWAGRGTGTGAGGVVTFATAPAGGVSGTTLNGVIERMRIDSVGNVGIGTASPASRLNVVGDQLVVSGGSGLAGIGIQIKGTAVSAIPAAQAQGYIATGDALAGANGDLLIAPRTNAATSIRFITGTTPAERVRIDATGNLGLGVTPPAWNNSAKVYDMPSGAMWAFGTAVTSVSTNLFYNAAGNYIYRANAFALDYRQRNDNGQHQWFTAPSGTAGNTVTLTERLRIADAGQIGIGGANYGTAGQTIISGGPSAAPAWGTLGLAGGGTGVTTAPAAAAVLLGYTATATAAGTTVLTNTSSQYQLFSGVTTQTITLPVTSTLTTGWSFHIVNNSTGNLTLNSSGGNLVATIIPGTTVMVTCILTSGTTAASWEFGYTDFGTLTGTGSVVMSDGATAAFALGAVATPSITFTGDLNTGIWSPAADTVAVSTAGAERLRVSSAGGITQLNATSGSGAIVGEQTFRLAADGSAIGPTIADFFGATSAISLEASSVYEVTIYAVFTKTTAGTATWTLTASSAPTRMAGSYSGSPATGIGAGATTNGFAGNQGATTAAFLATGSLTTAVNHVYQFEVQVQTNAATNFRLQLTQSAGTATPLAGSYYTVKKISATTGTFVA